MENKVIRIQGVLELSGPILFFAGILAEETSLIIAGGILMFILDILTTFLGVLNPFVIIIFGVFLGFIIDPWWYGVFWVFCIFFIINIPNAIRKIKSGSKILEH